MPYSSDKKRLPENLDRRRKLTEQQKLDIAYRYATESTSTRKLAAEYGVSKKTIQIIVNPEIRRKNSEHIKAHWKDYQPSREERNKIAREYRHYKHGLDKQGLLIESVDKRGTNDSI